MGTVKPQSYGPLYNNTVIGTLTVDGWAVTFGTLQRGWDGRKVGRYRLPHVAISPQIIY